ncbi:MAG TPA: hypothetical protein VN648_16165, partial [Candidatus Methylomirabilis sp.]|nr:hypothetical protein [Candidatus Methylomirabilis sp.]
GGEVIEEAIAMKKILCPMLTAGVLLLGSAFPSYAGGGGWHGGGGGGWHGNVVIGVGPGYWGPWWYGPGYPYYPYPYYPYPDYPYPYYGGPPAVMQQQPPVYIQQELQGQTQQPAYWYYCQNPQGYYPHVQECPGGWMTVVPPTTAPPH